MWKPGTAKPSKSQKSPTPDNDGNNNNNDRNSNTPPAAVARSQKSLSGATMNMRFMQRRNEQQKYEKKHQNTNRQPSPKREASPKKDDPMQVDNEEIVQSPLVFVHHPDDEDALIDTTPATTSDMYGIGVDIIGRRSFGGFNRVMEDSWKGSYRAQKDGTTGKLSNQREKSVTDEELLSRYANRRNNGDDASRRPVGNLGDKVRPRRQIKDSKSRNSGEKRKRN